MRNFITKFNVLFFKIVIKLGLIDYLLFYRLTRNILLRISHKKRAFKHFPDKKVSKNPNTLKALKKLSRIEHDILKFSIEPTPSNFVEMYTSQLRSSDFYAKKAPFRQRIKNAIKKDFKPLIVGLLLAFFPVVGRVKQNRFNYGLIKRHVLTLLCYHSFKRTPTFKSSLYGATKSMGYLFRRA